MPHRSTDAARPDRSEDREEPSGRAVAAFLLEAGMDGDLAAWEEGLLLACDVVLTEAERTRLVTLGGPPPLELERLLQGLGTPLRPPGHVARLQLLAERYRLALDGNFDLLRWVETAVGHPPGSLGRSDLLGPHGLPLHVQDLAAGLEPGPLPTDWLHRVDARALADVCSIPAEPAPVWAQLRGIEEDAEDPVQA